MYRYLTTALVCSCIVFVQTTLAAAVPMLQWLNLPLCTVVFLALVLPASRSFWWAVMLGLGMELYSFLPFGMLTSIYVAAWGLSVFFQQRVFTDFSLYTTILVMALVGAVYRLLLIAMSYLVVAADVGSLVVPWSTLAGTQGLLELAYNTATVVAGFFVGKLLTQRLNLAILKRE